ncbi:Zn(2)-C6 fungal-type domain-containing protein [Fusarium sp. LHS14.1]|nr:Zn(2)-C6 fungal-type domain-containing protein [Fusarium sp. LHS14.1]
MMSKPCWECLKRRLVCDLGRPGCQKCQSRDTECPGYDKKPLKWLHPGQTRSKGRRAKNESNVIQLALKDTTEATTLFEAIEYYNVHICPDLVANGSGATTKSPFIIPLANAPYAPATIRHCLVSSALAHRILQSEQGFEEDRAILASRLQTYRGAAIRHLACGVKHGSEVGWNKTSGREGRDATLASMLVFLFAELQQSFSPNWRQHSDAAHTLIELFGGTAQLIQEWPWFNHLFRYFILIDIMGTVTAPAPEVERTNRQLEYIGLLPSMYGVGLWTSLPCPPELLADIILVNHMRATATDDPLFAQHQHSSAIDLLERIMVFSVDDWAASINPYPQPKTSDKTVIQRQTELLGWQRVAYIYQSAVALYCISSLLTPDYNSNNIQAASGIDVSSRQSSCRKALLQDLRDVALDPKSELRKYLMWPTVIAGIELDADDETSKAFILDELAWASKMFGTASLLVAQDLLKRIWGSGKTGTRNWDDLFDRPYAFVM